MSLPVETVLAAAMELPEGERFALVARLLETMPADDSAITLDDDALVEELDRRLADREGSVPWSELRAEQ
ncbi:MAG: hypothetical protein NTW96_05930 [Planctomycetia bacterium]|nr:hypothetical protein [Planctomycetia bacterium]